MYAYWAILVKKDSNSSKAEEIFTLIELVNVKWGQKQVKLSKAVMMRRQKESKKKSHHQTI